MSEEESEAQLKVKFSVLAFIAGVAPYFWLSLDQEWGNPSSILLKLILSSFVSSAIGKVLFPNVYDVWWRASLIGAGFSLGLTLQVFHHALRPLGSYLCLLASFHYLEYAVTGLTNPSNLKTDSFLLNHSIQYWLAAIASWIEHLVELYFFPSMKLAVPSYVLGVIVCLAGEALRKTAMFHAGRSFSHIVQSTKKDDHILITRGVFAYMRHPSYVGWFWWSIGTQIILANPVCLLAYAYVSWSFFNDRIYVEEYTLLMFFGQDYSLYQKRTPVGIPFIRGYVN